MGATITCNKKVGAFRADDERVLYALFEETYEKNCYPHTPKWSCVAFGAYEEVLEFVFLAAQAAEGGMLQTRRGHTTPEAYIRSWMTAFKSPHALCDVVVRLKVSLGKWPIYDLGANLAPRMIEALLYADRPDLAQVIENETALSMSLFRDWRAIRALLAIDGLYPWRMLEHSALETTIDSDLAPGKRLGSVSVTLPELAVLAEDMGDKVVLVIDGPEISRGCTRDMMNHVIRWEAYWAECVKTGGGLEVIRTWREHLEAIPKLAETTRCTVTVTGSGGDRHEVSSAQQLAQELGVATEETCPERFEVTAQALRQGWRPTYFFKNLHPSQVGDWVIERAGTVNQTQQALFA